ncbi:MAG TPA: cold shock domain-containing protein, partial [Desertimonas sp.]|nr:cold shock domain-containing protein [Desertimonas sp.]
DIGIEAAISRIDLGALNGPPARRRAESPATPGRGRGVVAFFNGDRGYGFIDRGTGVDLFVHHSNLPTGTSIGTAVDFAVRPGRKGDEAHEVTLV